MHLVKEVIVSSSVQNINNILDKLILCDITNLCNNNWWIMESLAAIMSGTID